MDQRDHVVVGARAPTSPSPTTKAKRSFVDFVARASATLRTGRRGEKTHVAMAGIRNARAVVRAAARGARRVERDVDEPT